jgi:hypothetical protein
MQRRTVAPHHRSPPEADQRWRGERSLEPISTGLGAHAPPLNFQTGAAATEFMAARIDRAFGPAGVVTSWGGPTPRGVQLVHVR